MLFLSILRDSIQCNMARKSKIVKNNLFALRKYTTNTTVAQAAGKGQTKVIIKMINFFFSYVQIFFFIYD